MSHNIFNIFALSSQVSPIPKIPPEQTLIPDEEVAVEYCLHEKPALFNRHQFHQVYNPTEQLRVVAHIVYDTESWEKCKELSLIR